MSCLGGVGIVLVGLKMLPAAATVIGLTNVGVFFAGLSLERFGTENKKLNSDNESLQNEKIEIVRRMTTFNFPDSNTSESLSPPSSKYNTVLHLDNLIKNEPVTPTNKTIHLNFKSPSSEETE